MTKLWTRDFTTKCQPSTNTNSSSFRGSEIKTGGSRFPLEGCDQFDTWLDSEEVPRYWGTYSFGGGSGTIKMSYAEIPVAMNGAGLVLTTNKTEHKFIQLPAVDGARFSGTYEIPSWGNTIGTISFTSDGRFDDRGALDAISHQIAYPIRITSTPGGASARANPSAIWLRDELWMHRNNTRPGGRVMKAAGRGSAGVIGPT